MFTEPIATPKKTQISYNGVMGAVLLTHLLMLQTI